MNEGRYLDFGFEKMDGSEWCGLLKCGEFRRYNKLGWENQEFFFGHILKRLLDIPVGTSTSQPVIKCPIRDHSWPDSFLYSGDIVRNRTKPMSTMSFHYISQQQTHKCIDKSMRWFQKQ